MDLTSVGFLIIIWASSVSASPMAADVSEVSCFTDRDCPLSQYCSESEKCIFCFNCKKKNRQNAPIRCARTLEQCGSCLPGFMEDSFFAKMRCIPIKTVAEPQKAAKSDRVVMNNSWNENGEFQPYPPPPYIHEENEMNDSSDSGYSFQLRITELSENKTTAVPFQLPSYGGNVAAFGSTSHENSSDHTDGAANSEIPENLNFSTNGSIIDIHDETTTPSSWTPGASYGANENDENNSNLTNISEERISPPNKRRKTEEDGIQSTNDT